MPQAPKNATGKHCAGGAKQAFQLLVHISTPAKLLPKGEEAQQRRCSKGAQQGGCKLRSGETIRAPVPAGDQHRQRPGGKAEGADQQQTCQIVFQIPLQPQTQQAVLPALVGQLPGQYIGKGRSVQHRQGEQGHPVGFKPCMISEHPVQDQCRDPGDAERQHQEQRQPLCRQLFLVIPVHPFKNSLQDSL